MLGAGSGSRHSLIDLSATPSMLDGDQDKPMDEGMELGLSMIYNFAKQSCGQVRIYFEVGKGTSVRI